MEESRRIFADSNYFIALFNPKDSLRNKALELATEIGRRDCLITISNLIFVEVVTILSQKGGRSIAVDAGEYLLSNPFIEIIHVDETLQERSWQIFRETKSKDMGFVDCSIIAIMRAENLRELLTFDTEDFKKLKKNYRFNFYGDSS